MKRIFLILLLVLSLAGVSSAVITTKIYLDKGGDRQVIASTGEVLVQSGGIVTVESGGLLDIETGATLTYDDQIKSYPTFVQNIRERVTAAALNAADVELLPAIAGKRYRMVACKILAYGGAVGATTTIDVVSDNDTEVVLVAFAQASLTEDTVLKDAGTGAAVLAAGASYVSNVANTSISLANTGSNITTATGVDIILDYVIE